MKDEPQKADVIFVPGNGYPQMAAQQNSRKEDLRRMCFRREDTVLCSGISPVYRILRSSTAETMKPSGSFCGRYCRKTACRRKRFYAKTRRRIRMKMRGHGDRCGGHQEKKRSSAAGISMRDGVFCITSLSTRRQSFCLSASDIEFTRENWHTKGEWIDQVLGEMERCGGQFHKILRELPADSEF